MVKLIARYIKGYIPDLIGNILLVAAQIVLQTFFLMAEMKNIIDNGVNAQNFEVIWHAGGMMIFYTLLSGLCTVGSSYLSARLTMGMVCNMRSDCFDKISSMSSQDFNKFGASTLLTRTTADGLQIQNLMLNLLRSSMMVPMIIICMLILIFRMNKVFFWVLFIAFFITVAILIYFGARSKPYFELLQQKSDKIGQLVKEKLTGARSIRAFNNQKLEEKKAQEANLDARYTAIQANAKINFLAPISLIIMNWTVIAIYFIGSQELRTGMAEISDLLLIFQYLGYFIVSLAVIPVMVNLLPRVAVSSERINELLNYQPQEPASLIAIPESNTGELEKKGKREGINKGKIEFENVSFGYPGAHQDVISNISFVAEPGKVTAFIGATGSGKSSLVNLLMKLYSHNSGKIKIDGIDINEFDVNYLRERISYATQKAMIFQDTVKNNIAAYKDVDQNRINEAMKASEFAEIADNLPEKMDTVMSLGGMNLSGGQRQRLSLARTMAKDADIYIFDDTLSALDAKTELKVREGIDKMLKDKTILMVAQKINSIVDADNIIVLDNGQIVGQGKHEDLLKNCAVYQEIYETQSYMNEGSKDG